MVKRFLRYSLEHERPVKVLFLEGMKYKNIRVTALDEDTFVYKTAGRKSADVAKINQILSASYARGDDGDTLQYAVRELEQAEKDENGKEQV